MAAPDFDTYNCMEKFALHPDKVTRMGMEALIYRTGLRLIYEVGSEYKSAPEDLTERVFNLRIGRELTRTGAQHVSDLRTLTPEQREELYKKACRNAGIDIDKLIADRKAAKEKEASGGDK